MMSCRSLQSLGVLHPALPNSNLNDRPLFMGGALNNRRRGKTNFNPAKKKKGGGGAETVLVIPKGDRKSSTVLR